MNSARDVQSPDDLLIIGILDDQPVSKRSQFCYYNKYQINELKDGVEEERRKNVRGRGYEFVGETKKIQKALLKHKYQHTSVNGADLPWKFKKGYGTTLIFKLVSLAFPHLDAGWLDQESEIRNPIVSVAEERQFKSLPN